jgi:hypothetical protein
MSQEKHTIEGPGSEGKGKDACVPARHSSIGENVNTNPQAHKCIPSFEE